MPFVIEPPEQELQFMHGQMVFQIAALRHENAALRREIEALKASQEKEKPE